MRLLPVLYRLCWKELCRGWLMLALGLLLPPLAGHLKRFTLLEWTAPEITVFALLLGVSVWASMLAAEARGRHSYAGVHFPQHPALSTLVTFVLQGCAAALIGVSIGYTRVRMGHADGNAVLPLWAALYVASTFAASFIMSSALSPWSGIVTGIIWILGNGRTFIILLPVTGTYPELERAGAMLQMGGVIAVSLIAMAILALTMRLSLKWPRVLACLLLCAVILSRPLCWLRAETLRDSRESSKVASLVVTSPSPDGHYTLLIKPSPYGDLSNFCVDIWKIDNQCHRKTLLLPAWDSGVPHISWRGNDALFSCQNSVFSVSMTNDQLTPLRLPAPPEEKE